MIGAATGLYYLNTVTIIHRVKEWYVDINYTIEGKGQSQA